MAGVTFGPTVARVTGGAKAARFIRRHQRTDAADFARRFVSTFPIELLRSQIPMRTGTLRNSLHLRRKGAAVELWGAWYGRFKIAGGRSVGEIWTAMARAHVRKLGWFDG